MLVFIPSDARLLHDSWLSKWINRDCQQDPPHLVLCLSSRKAKNLGGPDFTWYDTCIQIILSFTLTCEFWCVFHDLLGKLKSGTVLTSVSSTFLLYDWGSGNIFAKINHSFTLHRISHVTRCVYILTKALPLFILLLKIAYVGLMVGGKKEACTCVTYIAKSNNGSLEITNHTSW